MVDSHESAMLPLDGTPTVAISLSNLVTAASVHPLIMLFGIEFYQGVNGVKYSLRNSSYNALSVIKVSGM
jgi:hypothetical protein